MDRPRVALVIPALNESATIKSVVEAARRYGLPIVVDDGSMDNTAELAKLAGAVVVSHKSNLGYDAALNSGFKRSVELGSEIVVTLDADGQHDTSLIQKFVAAIDDGADIVAGVRSRRQRFAEHLFAWYAQIRFGISDPLCGMKAYRVKVYKELGYFDSYQSIGTELLIYGIQKGYRLNQLSFKVRERSDKPRFGQLLSGNYKIIRAMVLSL